MSETRRLLDSPPPDPDLTRRVDHRHLPLVAIDDACTKEVPEHFLDRDAWKLLQLCSL